jgi:hypothetical protein
MSQQCVGPVGAQVQHGAAVPAGGDQTGRPQHAEVLRDAAGGDRQPGSQVGGGGRLGEQFEQGGAGTAQPRSGSAATCRSGGSGSARCG